MVACLWPLAHWLVAQLSAQDDAGNTPLHAAANKGKLAVVSFFRQACDAVPAPASSAGSDPAKSLWHTVCAVENALGHTAIDVANGRQVKVYQYLAAADCPVGSKRPGGKASGGVDKRSGATRRQRGRRSRKVDVTDELLWGWFEHDAV